MMKKKYVIPIVVVIAICVLFVAGPKENVSDVINVTEISQPMEYITQTEAKYNDITNGAEKQIVWADNQKRNKTQYAIVYIHGFSATSQEIRPVPDIVANNLTANLFFTRLKGHGRTSDAMGEASVNAWYNDTAEAIKIAEQLGEEIIVVSTSTGGTLSSWAAANQQLNKNIKAVVMVSPNYGINNPVGKILNMPWARQILPPIFGEYRVTEPDNEQHAKWWTTTYPTTALITMQATVDETIKLNFEDINIPALFIFHPDDQVVNANITKKVAERWGENYGVNVRTHEIKEAEDESNHVIAGDVRSPSNTQPIAQIITQWIRGI